VRDLPRHKRRGDILELVSVKQVFQQTFICYGSFDKVGAFRDVIFKSAAKLIENDHPVISIQAMSRHVGSNETAPPVTREVIDCLFIFRLAFVLLVLLCFWHNREKGT
jgi:hypothetical protein